MAEAISWVSIHAPAGGATLYRHHLTCPPARFNPRSRRGSDQWLPHMQHNTSVSIHAPAGGATSGYPICSTIPRFQSTLPQGERLRQGLAGASAISVSIHAPAGGATSLRTCSRILIHVSIHAPAGGATFGGSGAGGSGLFQSTLPQGERPLTIQQRHWTASFNPRSRRGSDGVP